MWLVRSVFQNVLSMHRVEKFKTEVEKEHINVAAKFVECMLPIYWF